MFRIFGNRQPVATTPVPVLSLKEQVQQCIDGEGTDLEKAAEIARIAYLDRSIVELMEVSGLIDSFRTSTRLGSRDLIDNEFLRKKEECIAISDRVRRDLSFGFADKELSLALNGGYWALLHPSQELVNTVCSFGIRDDQVAQEILDFLTTEYVPFAIALLGSMYIAKKNFGRELSKEELERLRFREICEKIYNKDFKGAFESVRMFNGRVRRKSLSLK